MFRLFLVLFALLTMAACSTPAPRPDPRPLDGPTRDMTGQLSTDFPIIIASRPSRLEPTSTLNTLLDRFGLRSSSSPLVALLLGATGDKAIASLDPARPILMGMYLIPDDDLYESVLYGNILAPPERPDFLHARTLLPSTDPKATLADLEALFQSFGMTAQPTDKPGASLWTSPGAVLLITHDQNTLSLDLADQAFDIKQATEYLLAQTTGESTKQASASPAWTHFLEADGALDVHMKMDALGRMHVVYNKLQMDAALQNASPEKRLSLHTLGMSFIMRSAALFNQADRNVQDATMGLGAGKDLVLRSTHTLTPAAAQAAKAAQTQRSDIYKARKPDPIAQLYLGHSLRALLQTRGPLAWQQDPAQNLWTRHQEGSIILTLYALQNEILLGFLGSTHMADFMPDSASMVVQDFSIHPERGFFLSAALIADFPAGDLPKPLTSALEETQAWLTTAVKDLPLTIKTSKGDQHTQLRVSIGDDLENIIALEQPIPPQHDLQAALHLPRVTPLLEAFLPQIVPLLADMETLEMVDHTDHNSHSTLWRLRPLTKTSDAPGNPTQATAALRPIIIKDQQKQEDSITDADRKATTCLLAASHQIGQLLDTYGSVPTADRLSFQEAVEELVAEELACAQNPDDPKIKNMTTQVYAGWQQFAAQVLYNWGYLPEANALATQSCAARRTIACDLHKKLDASATHQTPKVPWPGAGMLPSGALQLAVTPEEVFLNQTPLAKAARLKEGPAYLPSSWLADKLPLPAQPLAEITLDPSITFAQAVRLILAADQQGYLPLLRVQDPTHEATRVIPLRVSEDTPPQALELFWSKKEICLHHQNKKTYCAPTLDPVALAKQVQAIPTNQARVIALSITGNPTWGQLAALLSALAVPPTGDFDTPEQLADMISNDTGLPTFLLRNPTLGKGATAAPGQVPLVPAQETVVGGPTLSQNEIARTLRPIKDKLHACYEKATRDQPGAIWRLSTSFTVDSDGTVIAVEVKNANKSQQALGLCIEGNLRSLRFPKPRGGGIVTVTYPFVFHPK